MGTFTVPPPGTASYLGRGVTGEVSESITFGQVVLSSRVNLNTEERNLLVEWTVSKWRVGNEEIGEKFDSRF
jgi:hypothetical protein